MKKLLKRPIKRKLMLPLPARPREQHDRAFAIYRDMGPERTYRGLARVLKERQPVNAAPYSTLVTWAKKERWEERVAEFDRGRASSEGSPAPVMAGEEGGEVGDDVEALEKAASQALATVLRASSVAATKPGDLKMLLETANRAMDMAARIKQERKGKASLEERAKWAGEVLRGIDLARRKDFAYAARVAAETACREAGTQNVAMVLKATAQALGLRVDDKGEIDVISTIDGGGLVAAADGAGGVDMAVKVDDEDLMAETAEIEVVNGDVEVERSQDENDDKNGKTPYMGLDPYAIMKEMLVE
jgi:hypothetical protein